MDSPHVMHLKTYQRIVKQVWSHKDLATSTSQLQAVEAVHELYHECDPIIGCDDIIDIPVSYDSTWHKRGHTSHFDVDIIVDHMTGLVLDIAVLNNYCQACKTAPSEEDLLFLTWKEKHAPDCGCNYTGRSTDRSTWTLVITR
ncbi:hypothetical protein CAPTEDRAFT_213791 [Capitella teleta]|uniref:Mutator-like transposase domain-containing protein n=1 Tax=Capitella teleta TaxID=283909 RepID=R7UEN5_CAPTE|nr:hypothetical protein CAPTEDRAFT_213791 [Capitella teleta]|eukprot:ELU02253.1 hypothetical protein CAPTEDRAFT_213791 [Capitella teleta]